MLGLMMSINYLAAIVGMFVGGSKNLRGNLAGNGRLLCMESIGGTRGPVAA